VARATGRRESSGFPIPTSTGSAWRGAPTSSGATSSESGARLLVLYGLLDAQLDPAGLLAALDAVGVPHEELSGADATGRFAVSYDDRARLIYTADAGIYTNVSEDRFVCERRGRYVIGSACSGHGFKFAPAVGELLADAL
jgi:hypothetical protein